MADSEKKLRNGEIGVTIEEEKLIWRDRKRIIFGLPWSFTTYKLTPSRLIVEKGFLNKSMEEVRLYRITDVQFMQFFGERLFNLGDIKLFSSDATMPFTNIRRVKNALKVKEVISQAVEISRRDNGVRTSELVGGMARPGVPEGDMQPPETPSMGPNMFPDYDHNGIDDRTE